MTEYQKIENIILNAKRYCSIITQWDGKVYKIDDYLIKYDKRNDEWSFIK